jgi:hypothetical protein
VVRKHHPRRKNAEVVGASRELGAVAWCLDRIRVCGRQRGQNRLQASGQAAHPPGQTHIRGGTPLGNRLRVSLGESRAKFDQSGDRGEGNAKAFRDFLRAYLPPKYRIGQGEVIDHQGNRSRQTDVVVADEEQPFSVDESPQQLIIEGVAAAGEIKTTLTVPELRDSLEKAQRFKRLTAILGKATMLVGRKVDSQPNSDVLRFSLKRPYFVFAYSGAISTATLVALAANGESSDEPSPIDTVFVLEKGFALNFWNGIGRFPCWTCDAPKGPGAGGGSVIPSTTLVGLVFWLHAVMPRFAIRSSPLVPYLFPGTTWTRHTPPTRTDAETGDPGLTH